MKSKIAARVMASILFAAVAGCATSQPPYVQMQTAIRNGDMEGAQKAIDASKGTINGVDGLFAAIDAGSDLALRYFIFHGDANSYFRQSGETALMRAASKFQVGVATLLEAGARVSSTDRRGWTALDYANFHDRRNTATLLMRAGAKANLSPSDLVKAKENEATQEAEAYAENERQIAKVRQEQQEALRQSIANTNTIISNTRSRPGGGSGTSAGSTGSGTGRNFACTGDPNRPNPNPENSPGLCRYKK